MNQTLQARDNRDVVVLFVSISGCFYLSGSADQSHFSQILLMGKQSVWSAKEVECIGQNANLEPIS